MPELPEVETVLRTLEHQLQHPTILHCDVFWQRTIAYPDVKEFQSTIIGKRIEDYRRFGKFLIFDLGTHIWVCHLRMEGKFYVQDAQVPYDKHVHVMFTLDNGKQLAIMIRENLVECGYMKKHRINAILAFRNLDMMFLMID